MLRTATVQKGTRSTPGTSSATNVGRNSQCQPSRRTNAAATARSSTSSAGDKALRQTMETQIIGGHRPPWQESWRLENASVARAGLGPQLSQRLLSHIVASNIS